MRLNLTTNASFQILSDTSLTKHPTIQRYTQYFPSLPAYKNNKKNKGVSVHDTQAHALRSESRCALVKDVGSQLKETQ
jgi:hypothetical protein